MNATRRRASDTDNRLLDVSFPRIAGRWSRGGSLALLLALAPLAACTRSPAPPPSAAELPDVLLVTIDTLRADHTSAYGYPIPTTPVLEKLAAGGMLFRHAYAESATTGPSHASLMTGRHFRTLGVMKNGHPVPEDAVTLAEALAGHGYATAAFVSSFPVRSRFGFGQGFEFYEEDFALSEASLGRRSGGRTGEMAYDRIAEATVRRMQTWFEQREDPRPLFAWVHFVDPHHPYQAPEPFEADWPEGTSQSIRGYDGEVRYADKQLGVLLEAFAKHTPGREDFVVVTSDHGEGLGDHDWMSHGVNLYEEAVRVPLVVRWPGRLPAGKVVEEPVALVDIMVGILDLLGIEEPPGLHGFSLFGPIPADRPIFLQRRDYLTSEVRGVRVAGDMTAIVRSGSKLVVAPEEARRELYDLRADPGERRSRLGVEAPGESVLAEADSLERTLAKWRDVHVLPGQGSPLDEESLRALRALGYVE